MGIGGLGESGFLWTWRLFFVSSNLKRTGNGCHWINKELKKKMPELKKKMPELIVTDCHNQLVPDLPKRPWLCKLQIRKNFQVKFLSNVFMN
ncbi:hypothetical protein B0E43_02525 [Algoriphagus sp. A40]|nr:hypothetical protein B0E43_02525 [Algoriphagus sp. A40]